MLVKKTVLIYFLCIILIILFSLTEKTIMATEITDMELVSENKYLSLHIDKDTAQFAIKTKESNDIWYSNPPDWEEKEQVRSGSSKNELSSQFSIRYYDPEGTARNRDTRNSSIAYNQFQIKNIDKGIRIEYSIGKKWDDDDYLPLLISKERLENDLLAHIKNEKDREFFRKNYILINLIDDGQEQIEIKGLDRERLFGDYRFQILSGTDYIEAKKEIEKLEKELKEIEEQKELSGEEREEKIEDLQNEVNRKKRNYEGDKRDLIWRYINTILDNRRDYDRLGEIKAADTSPLKEGPVYILDSIPRFHRADMIELAQQAGYTPEDKIKDNLQNHIDPPVQNLSIFTIPVELYLEGDNLLTKIPAAEIDYPEEVIDVMGEYGPIDSKVSFPLSKIFLLKYFGAGSREEEGYMFVPDGSGALINFNNDKLYSSIYGGRVYGEDYIFSEEEKIQYSSDIRLPVFGIKKENKALFGIIEEGSSLATINADIAGRSSSFNTVFPSFTLIEKGEMGLGVDMDAFGYSGIVGSGTGGKINVYQPQIYQGDIKIRYAFMDQEQANYSGMANYYRQYLVDNHYLTSKNESDNDLPFYLGLLGAIPRQKPIMGIPFMVREPLTTFNEGQEIVEQLITRGVSNLAVNYTGWLKGGTEYAFPEEADVEDNLGGKNELLKFNQYLRDKDITLFLESGFLNIYQNYFWDNFIPSQDASRNPENLIAKKHDYNIATNLKKEDRYQYILSPSRVPGLMNNFFAQYMNLDIEGISFAQIGKQVNSDFRRNVNELINRQQAKNIQERQLEELKNKNSLEMMFKGGNDYVLPYTQNLIEVPMNCSDFNIFDREIPFYQMVIHGFKNYAGEPINLASNYQNAMLKTIETGAIPYFKWIFKDSSVLKNTDYQHLNSIQYNLWLEDAADFYHKANSILSSLEDKQIINHEQITKNVYKTTYENGDSVIVNYNDTKITINEIEVEEKSFKLIKGEEK